MSRPPSVYSPGTLPNYPFIVYVFPEPVCPYAKHVTLAPLNAHYSNGLTHEEYIYSFVEI